VSHSRSAALGGAAAAVFGVAGMDGRGRAVRRRRKRLQREKRRLRRLRRQPCGLGGACRVFITNNVFGGIVQGLNGADTICQDRATAQGLPGTYKVWLSDDTDSPSTRFVQSPGAYRLLDGTRIAANWDDLTDGTPDAPIDMTEQGNPVNDETDVWTHTRTDGTALGGANHCANWGSAAGDGDVGTHQASNAEWTGAGSDPCNTGHHLYCFQQDGPRL
jgi:hypothetical protein